MLVAGHAQAHDLERTQVLLAFARDGSFVLDVANDPSWLKLRLESFPGSFADRVVLWVDGHEVRPTSVEYLPPAETDAGAAIAARGATPSAFERRCIPAGCVAPPSNIPDILSRHALPSGRLAVLGATMDLHHGLLGRHRLRGRFPADAHTLRWYYGLVIDPYPLTVRRADGRVLVEEISGDAWSRTIDVSGQFQRTWVSATVGSWIVAGLLLVPLAIRIATKTRKHETPTKSYFALSWFRG